MADRKGISRTRKRRVTGESDEEERPFKRKNIETIEQGEKKKVKTEKLSEFTSPKNKASKSPKGSGGQRGSVTRTKLKKEIKKEEKPQKTKKKSPKKPSKKGTCHCRKLVGAHVSIQGGLHKAVYEAVDIGARSFAMFLKSQRQWSAKPMEEKAAEKFREACREYGFAPDEIIPHGSYLLNCGSPNPETLKKSRDSLVDEMKRCERLGISLYNFHPGSTCGNTTVEKCIATIAQSINIAHSKTKYVTAVIENMCCQGNTIGGKFEELRGIIDKVKDKSRIGVCLDTCHAFAAGFDLTSDAGYKKFISDFKRIIGFKYLKAVHLNDSKGVKGCHSDRHENIGKGHIGLSGFQRVMTDPHFNNIPMILETPGGFGYDKEIKILHKLC